MNSAPVNAMNHKKNESSSARIVVAVALLAVTGGLGGFVLPALAAPTPQVITPSFVQGGHDYTTAATVLYNTTGSFFGARNATSGAIEPIRGTLAAAAPASQRNDYYKIDLARGKVLDVRLRTIGAVYVPFGGGQRVSPDFELFTYAGIPSSDTMLDWNIAPFTNLIWQENNILTPISPSATYYINVSAWYGLGQYDLFISVTDPVSITGGDYAGALDQESVDPANSANTLNPDTMWYRFTASHDTASQAFHEASGWLDITNWNSNDPTQIDAIIRIFTEDTGYSPSNPIGKPIEKSEAPNRKVEPFNILAPYTGTYYIMLRTTNTTAVAYNLHFNLTLIPRFPAGGLLNIHKERTFDDTDWFWFNMTKGSGTSPGDRAVFNMSETSDDPLKPVNLNLWLFGYRDFFHPGGSTADFDILNSSFEGDAPYNLTLNPDPRHEEVAATAMYTGIYFIEVEDYNNTGNYSLIQTFDTSASRPGSDNNNEPSQAASTDWGRYTGLTIDQSDDHSDFYRLTARAGETIEVTYNMPPRTSPDKSVSNATLGLIWLGIYQPGMQLLNWSWNYHLDYQMGLPFDHLENTTTVRATVAADGDYIIEVTAMQDGFIGAFNLPGTPPRTIQVFWHMDWNMHTSYDLLISRLPTYNAEWELPVITNLLPDVTLNEGDTSAGVFDLKNFFYDPDILQGDVLSYTFTPSGPANLSLTESNGLVTIRPYTNFNATPVIDNMNWSGTNTFQVQATDLQRNHVSQYWNITYLPVNDPPYLVTNASIRFNEDQGVVILPLINYIRDVDGDPLTITQVADPNITLSFTDTTIRIVTVPDFQTTTLNGDYPVDVNVFDGTVNVTLRLHFNITNLLDAPRARMTSTNVSCDEDMPCPALNLNTVFYDPDDPLHKSPLNFLISGNGEIQFTIFNGSLQLSPPADWNGAKTIQVQAIKFSSSVPPQPYPSDVVEINLIVRSINDPPRLVSRNPDPVAFTLQEGASRSFQIDAVDPEHLQPTYRWFLDGVTLDTTLPTYTFVATFDMSHPGNDRVFNLSVVADDGVGGTISTYWLVTVVDLPRPPLVTIAAPLEGNRGYETGKPVTFFASALDPDNDVLTFTWTDSTGSPLVGQDGQPCGATCSVTFNTKGTQKIQLSVSDGVSQVTASVNVTIQEPAVKSPGFDTPIVVGALGAVAAVGAIMSRRRRVA
jgi:hypothetical protein